MSTFTDLVILFLLCFALYRLLQQRVPNVGEFRAKAPEGRRRRPALEGRRSRPASGASDSEEVWVVKEGHIIASAVMTLTFAKTRGEEQGDSCGGAESWVRERPRSEKDVLTIL
uniref:Uncharacterized protein n=1 Tax=Branchiostoma floridae TaxID=7739 RepID=C3Y856_BRAFL|eukprot:XP_002607515.1 hypothetical protein BRAFLDRAFT_69946 [Branchiostoma floridae]